MFCIDVKKTKALLTELQNQLRTLNHILSETEEKMIGYFAEEKKDECYYQMKSELEHMKQDRVTYLMLISVLREVIQQYEETEEKILEFSTACPRRISAETAWITVEYGEEMYEFIKQVII